MLRQRNRRPIDAVTVLSGYYIVLLTVPSLARFAPAGSVGAPAILIALLLFMWWLWDHANRSQALGSPRSWIRRFGLMLMLVVMLSFAHASLNPLPSDEVTPALSGMLQMIALLAVTFVALEGVPDMSRLMVLTRRMTVVGACAGALAIVQFLTHQAIIDQFPLPGLSMTVADDLLTTRGAFTRPSGTAVHPLEFGAVMTMLLPIALNRAVNETQHRFRGWIVLGLIGVGAMVSLSRSAIIAIALGLVVLAWHWSWKAKARLIAVMIVGVGLIGAAVPGLVRTLLGLFTQAGTDSSVQSRSDSYAYSFEFLGRYYLLGKGPGLFLPKYWILDNGFLSLLLGIGIFGLAALLLLLVAGFHSSLQARKLFTTPRNKAMCQTLLAALTAGTSTMAFFDFFGFIQASHTFFLLLGLAGAAYRIAREGGESDVRHRAPAPRDRILGHGSGQPQPAPRQALRRRRA